VITNAVCLVIVRLFTKASAQSKSQGRQREMHRERKAHENVGRIGVARREENDGERGQGDALERLECDDPRQK
jgi:hypothetical protein